MFVPFKTFIDKTIRENNLYCTNNGDNNPEKSTLDSTPMCVGLTWFKCPNTRLVAPRIYLTAISDGLSVFT